MTDMILSLHSLGETRIPPENPTPEQIKVYLGDLMSLEVRMTVAVRFEIGNTLLDMNIEHNEKFAFCEKYFGQRAKWILECMAIARAWVFNQNVGWAWSYYKEFVKLDKYDKEQFVKLYKQGRLKTMIQAKELKAQLLGESTDSEAVSDQIPYVGNPAHQDNNVIEAELRPATPALPPAPEQQETPEDLAYQLEIDNAPKVVTDHVADFFAAPTPVVEAGMRHNNRQVIEAAMVIESDYPGFRFALCCVPEGMTLRAGDTLTVAIRD